MRLPVLFVGHGSPMNAIEDNRWSRGFAALAELSPKPSAILAISAHWFVDGTFVTSSAHPETIHDFSGFPKPLYEINYPAPGNVALARRVLELVGRSASLSESWGLDHGTWSVLRWMYPDANVPVLQLSIDRRLDVGEHYALGRSLAELRREGVLVIGSGNVVHNLGDAFGRMRSGTLDTPEWASRFDRAVADAVTRHDVTTLVDLWPGTDDARQAHPSPDHWLPLIYAVAAADAGDRVSFPNEGFDLGSISMRCVAWE